jgi:hypothetical protein
VCDEAESDADNVACLCCAEQAQRHVEREKAPR